MSRITCLAAALLALACAPKRPADEAPPPKPNIDPGRISTPSTAEKAPPGKEPEQEEEAAQPMVPPEAAYSHGWMALASTGVEKFLQLHPTYDGRGVLIAILDTGIDPGIPGLLKTTTDAPKILDLRDFSNEGSVPLSPVKPAGDTVQIGNKKLGGFGRVAGLSVGGTYYGGTISELPLGELPAADLNGNGANTDTLVVLVTRASDGWVLLADTDGDGSLAGERPVHDYLVARESFGWARRGRPTKLDIAANFSGGASDPRLDLVFDSYSHGSHVAGIAAGHDLYGVAGFNGVAPGAQLLGLKIANSAQGSITTTGSLIRAIDYAIRFARERRLPLVLNLSFGVGNEIEGTARIDGMIDSVLAVNPDVVFAISAGNDGPGISTMGFPGSARRSISVGATLPESFLPAGPGGSREDQLAYFSSRGGQLAKPDLVTPGVAYSTVPRWNIGHEIEQGTSMAAPHASGLAALLVSLLTQEKRPIVARDIKQALMVTARPLHAAGYIDEGTGLPQVEQASEWLKEKREIPDIAVTALDEEGRASAGVHQRAPGQTEWVQRYQLTRSDSAASSKTYTLRSDAAWAIAPARVTLSGRTTTVQVRYRLAELKSPGAYSSLVSGWSEDSLAGPAFRLVSTVIAPDSIRTGTRELRTGAKVEPGGELRSFFLADSARPLELRISGANVGQKGLAFLHEPGGMPYRDEYTRSIGSADREAVYQLDARDVVAGAYEAVMVAPTVQPLSVNMKLTQAPYRLQLQREKESAVARISNVSGAPARAELAVLLGGAERIETVVARGSEVRRIPFVAPPWAKAVVVDITMDRAQWSRFTDFGVTLFDSAGRQVEKQPLNYAFGRLQAKLPEEHGALPLQLSLFPGFADPAAEENWTLRAAIRLYADSAVTLDPLTPADSSITIAPGKASTVRFTLPASPWPLGDGFFPLGVVVARTDEHTWTREGGLPLPNPAMMR